VNRLRTQKKLPDIAGTTHRQTTYSEFLMPEENICTIYYENSKCTHKYREFKMNVMYLWLSFKNYQLIASSTPLSLPSTT
jgi:hypothetical protein